MTELTAEEAPDRIVLKLDSGGPMEVSDLTTSFAALARLYERHYRAGGEPAPKLYVTKLESGSIVAEVSPLILLLGTAILAMDSSLIVTDFTNRLTKGIKAFADPGSAALPGALPSRDDAADIREFVRPLAGKKGASLGIKHARFIREDGERRTIAEYIFDEAEINRATINIDGILAQPDPALAFEDVPLLEAERTNTLREVMLFFEQASRKPGREKGRTGDRGIIPDVSDRALPVYFRKSFQDLKDKMIRGETNPLTDIAFVVDVHVQRLGSEPRGYIVTEVHQAIPLDDPKS